MRALRALVTATLLALIVLPAPVGDSQPLGVPAQVVDIEPPSTVESYPMVDFGRRKARGDDRRGRADWLVVERTGNCCENFVTITKEGRLLDFGGTYINYTDNSGKTWKSVRPLEPLLNGEGAIVLAPGGDVLGVEWDPYSGDHLLAFKYDSASEGWFYNEMPLHTPFFDREWIAVVPGPFTFAGVEIPYVSFVKGAYPTKELWLFSIDGLNYVEASSKFVDQTLSGATKGALEIKADKDFDWIQPNNNMGSATDGTGITPLGEGAALASPDYPFNNSEWSLLAPDTLRWSGYRFPQDKNPQGLFQTDSAGRLHNVIPRGQSFDYRISTSGGRSWRAITVALPKDHSIEEIAFRANKAVGIAAVAIHGHDGKANADQDLLYKLDIRSNKPFLSRFYEVGLGDVSGSSGLGADVRFDFETVAIFPDGRVAMSFYDSTTTAISLTRGEIIGPALAIERATKLRR